MQHDRAETHDDLEQRNLDPVNETTEDADDREKSTEEAVVELVYKMSTPFAQIAKLIDSQNHARDMANNLADSARAAADLSQVQQNIVRVAQDLAASQDVIRQSTQAAQKQANAVKLVQDLVDSPASRTVRETAARFSRWQTSQAEAIERAQAALKAAANAVVPWLKNAARAVGRTVEDFYRRSLPPNWLIDDTIPPFSLVDAMHLALNEGIPLAWAADPETVSALMSVPADHPARREEMCAVLTKRSGIILAYSSSRLDALAGTPSTPKELLSAIDVAQQSIRALRLDLPAPAQSAAANLVDHLISQLFAPLAKNGVMGYRKKREHVENLPQQVKAVSLTFLVVLREMVNSARGSEGVHRVVAERGTSAARRLQPAHNRARHRRDRPGQPNQRSRRRHAGRLTDLPNSRLGVDRAARVRLGGRRRSRSDAEVCRSQAERCLGPPVKLGPMRQPSASGRNGRR